MDEVVGAEARELPVRVLAGVLAVLLGAALIVDQTFWGMMDGFLDKLLVPVVETQADVFAKVQSRASRREDTEIEHEMNMLLDAAAIPGESGLLLKDAVPTPSAAESSSQEPESKEEDAVVMRSIISDVVMPQAEETENLTAEATLPEIIMPMPEEPYVIVPEYLPDVSVIVEDIVKNVSEPDITVPENPDNISTSIESGPEDIVIEDIENPSEMVSEQRPDTSTPSEAIIPTIPTEPEVIMPEKPAEEPVMPEPAVPDMEITEPGAAEDVPADIVEEENEETAPASCFLLDEAGMLYGFLPEYADIADGCLALPAECTGIRSGAFMGCGAGIMELYIPAGASVIEEGAFSGLDNLEWIDVEGGNPGYASEGGVLFDSTRSVLVKFPNGRLYGYSVPYYVALIADRAFEGTSIYRLDIRNCADLSFGANAFGYSAGNGIEIAVPEAKFDMYTQMLSGYGFILTK